MYKTPCAFGLAAGLLLFGFGPGTARSAAINSPLLAHPAPAASAAVVPAAWCVYPRGGGFRVPGPPGLCYRYGAVPGGGVYRPYWGPRPYYGWGPPRPYWGPRPYGWGPRPYGW